jgi:nucleotide-binding universal stress UspA family protein
MKIETILVPTDFSEQAENALATAIEFAKAFGARIELLHVYDIPDYSSVYEVAFPDKVTAGIKAAAKRRLDEWHTRAKAAGIEVSSHLEFGSPGRVIPKHAEDTKTDLIVMGTRGLGAIQHVLLGSVVDRTIRTAPCPVLSIGAHANERD